MEDRRLAGSGPCPVWGQPYWDHLALLRRLQDDEQLGLCDALNRIAAGGSTKGAAGLRFVAPQARSAYSYETRIHAHAEIETRDNAHDRLNALVWLAFPQAKAAINRVHVRDLATPLAGNRRSTARDGATLLDESGLVVLCDEPALLDDLRDAPWQDLFVTQRERFRRHARCFAFGHGLLEKLAHPYKALTGHALVGQVPAEVLSAGAGIPFGAIDALCARTVEEKNFGSRTLIPIPVLGLPGWCCASEDPRFYDDPSVFRPRSRRSADRFAAHVR